METVMIILFGIGVAYAALTAIVGDLFSVELHAGELPFLSPTIIATFITVFGGFGYMLQHHTSWSIISITSLALLVAVGVSSAVLFLVVVPLQTAQKGMALSSKDMIGLEAKVIISIQALRLGEIVYEQGGIRHNAPAKAMEDSVILQGSQVRILDEMAGTFVVEKI